MRCAQASNPAEAAVGAMVAAGMGPPGAGAMVPPGDEPTHEEIVEYAVYLGMDPTADVDLLYIAEWALTAPLPDGWTEHRCEFVIMKRVRK